MKRWRVLLPLLIVSLLIVSVSIFRGCAMRPKNPPLGHYQERAGLEFEKLELRRGAHEDLVVLAFSGGGMRAASFAYGVLEELRSIEISDGAGGKTRLLD